MRAVLLAAAIYMYVLLLDVTGIDFPCCSQTNYGNRQSRRTGVHYVVMWCEI